MHEGFSVPGVPYFGFGLADPAPRGRGRPLFDERFGKKKKVFFSGVEKLTRSSLKGLSNWAPFAYKNGRFASRSLLLGIGFLEASKKANCLSKVPLQNPI